MTDKQIIQQACADLGLEHPRDYFLGYSDNHHRWEFHHSPRKPIYGSSVRAIIRAIRRHFASKTQPVSSSPER